VLMGLSHVYSG